MENQFVTRDTQIDVSRQPVVFVRDGEYLRAHGWVYRRPGTAYDLGYQSKVQAGLLEHKVTTVTQADGTERITEQVRVTPKGLTVLAKVFPSAVSSAA